MYRNTAQFYPKAMHFKAKYSYGRSGEKSSRKKTSEQVPQENSGGKGKQ